MSCARIAVYVVIAAALVQGGSTDERVDAIVSNLKKYVTDQGLSTIPIPDQSFRTILASGGFSDASFQDLSTLKAVGEDQTLNATTADVLSLTSFDLTLGVDTFLASHEYHVTLLRFLTTAGRLEVKAKTSVARARGSVTRQRDGTCRGSLDGLELVRLDDVTSDYTPPTFWNKAIATVVGYLRFFTSSDLPRFNEIIDQLLQNELAMKAVSDALCQTVII